MDPAARKVTCPKCHGQGGSDPARHGGPDEDDGDDGRHPCFRCSTEGRLDAGELRPPEIALAVAAGEVPEHEAAALTERFLRLNPAYEDEAAREAAIQERAELVRLHGPDYMDVLDPGYDPHETAQGPFDPPSDPNADAAALPPGSDDEVPF